MLFAAPSDRITFQPLRETVFSVPSGKLTVFTEWLRFEHAQVCIVPSGLQTCLCKRNQKQEGEGRVGPRSVEVCLLYVQGVSTGQKQDGIPGQKNICAPFSEISLSIPRHRKKRALCQEDLASHPTSAP